MKKTGLYIFILAVSLAACNSQPFPGCCGPTGTRDVPFLETYLFDFRTGAGPITKDNPDGNLQIISAGDLLTLLAAAQDNQNLGLGVVSGLVLFNGAPVQDVALKVTDADGRLLAIRMEGKKAGSSLVLPDGTVCPPENVALNNICIRGSIYYNSPGGVPDFSNNIGTSTEGTFTIFNLPPGDVYLWAGRGARGSGRIRVFANHISVGKLPVAPISIATAAVTGSVLEAKDESTAVPGATLSILGATDPDLTVTSDSQGLYAITSMRTNGDYLMKVSKNGHWDTYEPLNTTPFQATSNIQDVTRTVESYSNSYVRDVALAGGVSADPSKGIITGRIKASDGTPQHCAKVSVTDAAGNDLQLSGAKIAYVDGSRSNCVNPNDAGQTSINGLFFIFNLPPGEVFLSYVATVSTGSAGSSNVSLTSGGAIVTAFPGVVFVQDMTNAGSGVSQELSGKITDESNAPLPNTQITILSDSAMSYNYDNNGIPATFAYPADAASDGSGAFKIRQETDPTDPNKHSTPPFPLMGGNTYRIQVSGGGRPNTYQTVGMADSKTQRNLLQLSASNTSDPSKGGIYGLLIDQASGKAAENITLAITDLNGAPLAGGSITSIDGSFRISNLPPGLVNLAVISGDDSGNIVARVYPNGVTYLEFSVTKAIPAQIAVSGTVKDLTGAGAQAQLRVLGRSDTFASGGSGAYSAKLESYGRFVVKAQKAGFYDTYNFFPATGIVDQQRGLDLYAIPRDQINAVAATAGVSLDPAKGIIAGTAVRNEFSPVVSAACGGAGPHIAVPGFFNSDTKVDLAITNCDAPNTLTILFGDGAGGFVKNGTVAVGSNPSAIATGDFDRNGTTDLLVANKGDNTLSVLLGDRNGNFAPVVDTILGADQKPYPSPLLSAPVAVAVGSFDSDSNLDVAVVNQGDSSVVVLLGNGNGTFHPIEVNANVVRNSVGAGATAIVAGDFNKDQRLDMAISNATDGTISVFLGSTDGTFQPLSDPNTNSPILIQTDPDPEALAVVDMNADGYLDLAVAHKSGNKITIFTGNNSGGFDPLKDANGAPRPAIPTGNGPSAIAAGEFNGDGRVDLAVTEGTNNTDSSVLVLFGNGDGSFISSPPESLGGATAPQCVLAGDVNRDGLVDLIVVGSEVLTLLGQTQPVSGVSVEARSLDGARVGTVQYLNSAGQVLSGSTATDAGGAFVILNVPPDITMVRSSRGGSGNSLVTLLPDSVSYAKPNIVASQPAVVSVSGVTYDPVGPPPAGVPVGPVNIQLLGVDLQTKSDRLTGNYSFNVDANSEYILKLFFDPPAR